jgi:hypothetical protein
MVLIKYIIFISVFIAINGKASTFNQKKFNRVVQKNKKVLFYFVSDGMPLSKKGLKHIKKIAKKRNYQLKILNDPHAPITHKNSKVKFPIISREEFYYSLGAFHHFPSTLVYLNGKQCGSLIPGYKDKSSFSQMLNDFESQCARHTPPTTSSTVSENLINGQGNLVHEVILPRPIKYYYRPINDQWITYHDARQTALFNRFSNEEIIFQGRYDTVPTPDAKYMTLPTPLRFFSMDEIFANPNEARNLAPLMTDNTMRDSYQSLALVNPNQYRAITAWSLTVAFRDFFEQTDQNGTSSIQPGAPKSDLCSRQEIATPILSKLGSFIGGFVHGQNGTDTTHVVRIGKNADQCTTALNIGMRTSKVDFSYDDHYVTYMAQNQSRKNIGPFVQEIQTGKIWRVTSVAPTEAFTFPSFLPNGNVIVLRIRRNKLKQREYVVQEFEMNYEN